MAKQRSAAITTKASTSSATTYDLIAIGTGSASNLIGPFLRQNPKAKVAIIDKDTPGGICLTRGCIPTKLLTTAADVVRTVEHRRFHRFSTRSEP